jgi:hypothetical protein
MPILKGTARPLANSGCVGEHSTFNLDFFDILLWVKYSRHLSGVAERRWKLAWHNVPGVWWQKQNVLKGQGKSGVLAGRMN